MEKYYSTDFKKLKKASIDKDSLELLPRDVVINRKITSILNYISDFDV